MKKKAILTLVITALTLSSIYLGLLILQNNKINKVQYEYLKKLDSNSFTEEIKNRHTLRRCNLNINSPEYYQVSGGDNDALVTFYRFNDLFLKDLNPIILRGGILGYTRVKNTTFSELLKMIKKDCSQFQEDYDNPDPNGIDWGYREAEPEPTPEEIEQERLKKIERMKFELSEMAPSDIQILKENYGYNESFDDEELYNWYESNDFSDFEPSK